MSKIIDFSSLYEERCVERRIDAIKKELKKARVSSKKLRELQQELYHLSLELTETVQRESSLSQVAMHEFLLRQADLGVLLCNCQNLFIDKQVDNLTKHAQKIAKASLDPCTNVSQKIGKLHQSILSLTHQEALSLENRQMIHLAKKYLHDASARCYHEERPKNTKTIRLDFQKTNAERDLRDPYETSLMLYEIAGDLYHHQIAAGLSSFFCLPSSVQQELKTLMTHKGSSLEQLKTQETVQGWKKNVDGIIQALLGYSNQLLYHTLTYPTIEEIDELFRDLAATLKEAAEDASANF